MTNEFLNSDYNTVINVIGGLADANVLYKAIQSHFSQSDSLYEFVVQRNELNLRTEKSRERIKRAIKSSFLQFINDDHQKLLYNVLQERVPLQDRALFLAWQFAVNNKLFRELTENVFLANYYSGRASLSKDDVVGYIKERVKVDKKMDMNWTESTVHTLATKYLNLMSKFGLLDSGRIKAFKPIRPTVEAQVIFIYFAKLFFPHNSNILVNELLPLSFLPVKEIQERYKKLSLKGYFDMNFNGVALNIDLTFSYKEICDALYN